MTNAEVVAIIGAISAATVAILGAVAALWRQVHATHVAVNSRMDQLLVETRASARAAGKAEPRIGDHEHQVDS